MHRLLRPLVEWTSAHDRGYNALRRAIRTALLMPALFAFGDKVLDNATVATFAAFGAFAMLLLVDFGGPLRARASAQVSLALTGTALACLGTLVSGSAWAAAFVMAVVAFAVLFAGVVSSVMASATTALLMSFILPVTLPGPISSVPDRLAGWAISAVVSVAAIVVLWPAPERNPLRAPVISACRALAQKLRLGVDMAGGRSAPDGSSEGEGADVVEQARTALEALRSGFYAAPNRPTSLSTTGRALVRLVDEIGWLGAIAASPVPATVPANVASAEVLERGADLLAGPSRSPAELRLALTSLRQALTGLEEGTTAALPLGTADIVSGLDPAFRAQELCFATTQVGVNIDFAMAAERRPWRDRLLGRQPLDFGSTFAAAQQRAASYFERHSVWLHNSIRGAIGLGLAVLMADLTDVQHSLWVVLGTLSVLRSNALSTGQTVLRAVAGTVAGFVVGAALLEVIGTNTTLLWCLLPLAILFAGFAPAAISFLAGQVGFTLTMVILFNIIEPAGWRVGLVRVEDIAIGCGVSLAVGALFWPRGAASALGQALSEAYAAGANYLEEAVRFGLGRCDNAPEHPAPTAAAGRAAAAARRLDDTFRGYLAERGGKALPLAEVSALVTGVAGLRLAADAVLDLWSRDDAKAEGDRRAARHELGATVDRVATWYRAFARSLGSDSELPEPLSYDPSGTARLVSAVSHDLRSNDGQATATAVRMIWTGDHLDAARRLQTTLVGPAIAAKQQRALTPFGGVLPSFGHPGP